MNRIAKAVAGGALAAALVVTAQLPAGALDRPRPSDGGATIAAVFDPTANYTANWTRAQALQIQSNASNTTPRIPQEFPIMTDEVWIWDTWPLSDLDMNPVSYGGWNIIFSLTAPRDIFFGDRHWVARIGFFYSDDAQNWTYGGDLFPADSAFGSREWAGSTVVSDDGTVDAFYTASGEDDGSGGEGPPGDGGYPVDDARQRLAHAQGRIHTDDEGVWFTGFEDYQIIAEADGSLYQTLEQSQAGPIIYAFRDPFVFRDPTDHNVYILFEGNNPGVAGTHTCDRKEIGRVPAGHVVPPQARFYTGNIGLMRLTGDEQTMNEWELLPPVLSAECTNQQTERPHLVVRDGDYYLWTISHQFTFAPGLSGPDGLYGFVGPGLRSNYQPLNRSALVLGNPASAPLQNYSHFVMPNFLVESFIDTIPRDGGGPDIYGGTLAPTLQLEVEGTHTELTGVLPYGYIPALREAGEAW